MSLRVDFQAKSQDYFTASAELFSTILMKLNTLSLPESAKQQVVQLQQLATEYRNYVTNLDFSKETAAQYINTLIDGLFGSTGLYQQAVKLMANNFKESKEYSNGYLKLESALSSVLYDVVLTFEISNDRPAFQITAAELLQYLQLENIKEFFEETEQAVSDTKQEIKEQQNERQQNEIRQIGQNIKVEQQPSGTFIVLIPSDSREIPIYYQSRAETTTYQTEVLSNPGSPTANVVTRFPVKTIRLKYAVAGIQLVGIDKTSIKLPDGKLLSDCVIASATAYGTAGGVFFYSELTFECIA